MNTNSINPEFGARTVSVYGGAGDALDDFPVLKAFQQYIDAEQAKARKRLLALGVFFGVLMLAVIAIFVVLLVSVSSRNQLLNDRLVEFAMKERGAATAPVVVQPPQDSAAVLAFTTKLEEMQRKLAEAQAKADKAVAEAEASRAAQQAAADAAKPKAPTAEELEIQRLKAALAAEKEKVAEEQKRRREEELEAYRRKHYPELYAPRRSVAAQAPAAPAPRQAPSRSADSPSSRATVPRDVVDQILEDLDRLEDETPPKAKGQKPSIPPSAADKEPKSENAATDALSPISYFEDDEGGANAPKAHALRIKSGETSLDWGIPD